MNIAQVLQAAGFIDIVLVGTEVADATLGNRRYRGIVMRRADNSVPPLTSDPTVPAQFQVPLEIKTTFALAYASHVLL